MQAEAQLLDSVQYGTIYIKGFKHKEFYEVFNDLYVV